VRTNRWKKWGLTGLILVVIFVFGGVGWWYRSGKNEKIGRESNDIKIEPLIARVNSEAEVPASKVVNGFVFRADDVVKDEVIEIKSVADWARVPGSREILYNRLDEKTMFLNGKLVRLGDGNLNLNWEGYEIVFRLGEGVGVVNSAKGKSIELMEVQAGSVVQVVLGVDEKSRLEVSSIMVL